MPGKRARYAPAAMVAVAACAIAWQGRPAHADPASQPAAAASTPAVGPIAYYVANCARCHGDVSAAYVGLDHPRRGDALKQEIDDMASGPAQAPLDAEGLKQQTLMHEAMFGKTPFVWLDSSVPNRTAGEVLSGTTLTFQTAGGPLVTPTVGDDSRFDLPKQPGTLIARRGDKVTKIAVH